MALTLQDEELLATELTVADPLSITPRLERLQKPCSTPRILGFYNKNGTDYPNVPCAFCGRAIHRKGFHVDVPGAGEALLGGDCGRDAFGLDWDAAEAAYEGLVQRRETIVRLRDVDAAADAFVADVAAFAHSPAVRAYDAFVPVLANSTFGRLLARTARGDGALMVDVVVRDEDADHDLLAKMRPDLLRAMQTASTNNNRKAARREAKSWLQIIAPGGARTERQRTATCDGYQVLSAMKLRPLLNTTASEARTLISRLQAASTGDTATGMLAASFAQLVASVDEALALLRALLAFTSAENRERLLAWRNQMPELRVLEAPSLTLSVRFDLPMLPGVARMRSAVGG